MVVGSSVGAGITGTSFVPQISVICSPPAACVTCFGGSPSLTKIDFPELLNKVRAAGGRVGVYPVSQQSWTDLGQWQEYQTAVKRLEEKS